MRLTHRLRRVSRGAPTANETLRGSGPMSAAALPSQRSASRSARVVRSEWTKLWSLRSTRWSLLVSVVAMAGLGILVSAVQMAHWNQMNPHDRATFNPVDVSLGGWHLAQLAIGVLGVLLITGEYSTGQIRSTFAAVPHRLPVLWAKAGVYATLTFVLMLVASFSAFLVSQPILRSHHVETTLSSPHVLRAVVGAALFLTVTGLLGRQPRRARAQHRGRHRRLRRADVRAARHHRDPPEQLGRQHRSLPAAERGHGHPRASTPTRPRSRRGRASCCSSATPLAALAVSAVLLVRRDA